MTILIFLAALLAAIALGVPIALALLVSGVALMIDQDFFNSQIAATNMINGVDNFIFIAIPFFILAGELMNAGGLSRRIVNMSLALVGHVRGGLGYVVVLVSCLMASLSGSAIADSAAMAALLLPMMRSAGYSVKRSVGLIAAGGIVAPIIPPSIGLIMFGVIGNVSITRLFLAGIFPGLLLCVALALVWWWLNRGHADTALQPRASAREVMHALMDGVWALGLPVIIVGGLRLSVFTPTESAVVAAFYALFVGVFIYRELTPRKIYRALVAAAHTNGVVMFIVAAAFVSAWMITIADLPGELETLLGAVSDHPMVLMAVMMLLTMLIGTALDFTPMVLILTPIMLPVARSAGIDPVYFGVVFILSVSIGLLTPPVGNVINVVSSVSRRPFEEVATGVIPFLLAEVAVVILLILFPNLLLVPLSWWY